MAKYNIYKINKAKESQLLVKLHLAGLVSVGSKQLGNYRLSFHLSINPEQIDIWWVDLYKEYIKENVPKNTAHFAVFVISNDELCYVVSMGKSHFYLRDFCDADFGINLAERIADPNHTSLKNSKLFGGRKSRTIVSYQANSELEYDSSESINYIKANTINESKWGTEASFGSSVQLKLDIIPDDLPQKIEEIEEELKKPALIMLPRANLIKEKAKIAELDNKLANEILSSTNGSVQAANGTVSGVDFIFTDKHKYQFLFKGKKSKKLEELDLVSLKEFIDQYKIDLTRDINNIKVKVFDEDTPKYTEPLKNFLDYVDDERHVLLNGKWQEFNENYIESLKKQIDERILTELSTINFSNSEYENWKSSLSSSETLRYCEYYFNLMREKEGYKNCDRVIEMLSKQFKIEKLDLYKDDTAFFVKIGQPQKVSYVIDQAIATIKILQTKTSKIEIDGQEVHPKKICLWLLIDRKNPVEKLSEMKSLILMIKLDEWQKSCRNSGYEPVVRIGYKVD